MNAFKIGLIIVSIAIFTACQTGEDEKRQAVSNQLLIQELQDKLAATQAELEASQAKEAELRAQIDQLTAKTSTAADQGQLLARVKELEEQKSHLEDLLTQLQLLRLNGQALPSESVPSKQADRSTPRPSASPSGYDAFSTPAPNVQLPDSSTITLEGDEMRLLGSSLQGRKDRVAVRGTPLFSERDSNSGLAWYYHRSYWYDKPGIFIDITRKPDFSYQAHLVVQSPVTAKSPTNTFGKLVFNKTPLPDGSAAPSNDFGFPSLRNYLLSPNSMLESLVYDLDNLTLSRLLQALDEPSPQYAIVRPDGDAVPRYISVDAANRKALLEMLQAYRDLRSSP